MCPIPVSRGSGSSDFTPHPSGPFPARCIDIHEVGKVETQYGPKEKLDFYFFCGQFFEGNDGQRHPLLVRERFTRSLHENGYLRPFLESWRGEPFNNDELDVFDVEKLLGKPAFIQVVHNRVGEKVFANISSIMRVPSGVEAPLAPEGYKRKKDKEQEQRAGTWGNGGAAPRAPAPTAGAGASTFADGSPIGNPPPPNWRDDDDDLPF